MSNTYREIMARVRLTMGEPHPAHPSEPVLFEALRSNVQLMFNQALNTPVQWSCAYADLTVQADRAVYDLNNATDFGKDVLVHTIDSTDPNHVERPINRMSMQSSLKGDHLLPQEGGNGWEPKHSAATFVFYRDGSSPQAGPKIKILPTPQETAQYRIWYETAEPNVASLDNQLIIPAGDSLLVLRVAFSCLPNAQWCGLTASANREKRENLTRILADSKAEHEREWRKYIATDRQAGLTTMRGFDDESYAWE